MQYVTKSRICIIIGIGLIVFVASLVRLPFMSEGQGLQKAPEQSMGKLEKSEDRLLGFIAHEKDEMHSKMSRIGP
jgi:hypothetical protein